MTSLSANGKSIEINADPTTPLLWALRDYLGMMGTKFGCGIAACGACTVLIDGQATRACVTPISSVGIRKVSTIEHVAANDAVGKAVSAAWVKHERHRRIRFEREAHGAAVAGAFQLHRLSQWAREAQAEASVPKVALPRRCCRALSITGTRCWRKGGESPAYAPRTRINAGPLTSLGDASRNGWFHQPVHFVKLAMETTSREEIKDEVWAQLKAALNSMGRVQLEDENLVDWFLDPDIQLPNPSGVTNAEPLLINHVGSLALRPEAYTEIGNLFLASDYVRTYTDLATMEAANEAARRATNSILAVAGVDAPPCEFWEFDVPLPMQHAQLFDQLRLRMGLPNLIQAATP